MSKKTDLLLIACIALAISAASIVVFNLNFGPIKIGQQLIRFILSAILLYFVYQERPWAKGIFIFLGLIGGLISLVSLSLRLGQNTIDVGAIVLPSMVGIFYLISSVYLIFRKKS